MKVRRISTTDELRALQPVWNDLAGPCPFHSWQWLHSWWETFAEQRELFVLVCENDRQEVCGLLPLCRERRIASGRVLAFLGTGKACTEYMSVFTSCDNESQIAVALADWLIENQPEWDELVLDNIARSDSKIARLLMTLEAGGTDISAFDGVPCWQIELPSSHEEYVGQLSKRHRRKLRNAFRKVIASSSYEIDHATDEAALQSVFDDFVTMHIRRRMAVDRKHCFQVSAFHDFLLLVAKRMQPTGMLDLTRSRLNGTVSGVQFGLRNDTTYFLYQSGMNPDLSQFSPGWAMNCYKIHDCVLNGMKTYDLLRGNERYKRHLGAKAIQTIQYRIANPSVMSRICHHYWKTRQTIKSWRDTLGEGEKPWLGRV